MTDLASTNARLTRTTITTHACSRRRAETAASSETASLAYWLADYAVSSAVYEEALAIARDLGDDALRADALFSLGFIDIVNGDPAALRDRHLEAGRLFEARGDRLGQAKVRQGLVLVSFLEGDWPEARRLAEEDVAFQREIGALAREADSETLIAAASIHLGELESAVTHLERALRIEMDLNLTVGVVGSLLVGSIIAVAAVDFERGAQIAGAVQELRDSSGSSAAPLDVLHLPDPVEPARAALGEAAFLEATRLGRRLPLASAVALALTLPGSALASASASDVAHAP